MREGDVYWNCFTGKDAAFIRIEGFTDDGLRTLIRIFSCAAPKGDAWPPVATRAIEETLSVLTKVEL